MDEEDTLDPIPEELLDEREATQYWLDREVELAADPGGDSDDLQDGEGDPDSVEEFEAAMRDRW